jgi:predicted nucleotidyltransferase
MRKIAILETLFPEVRAGVLSATLLQPDRWWFMTELAEYLHTTPSSLQRELDALVSTGLLLRRKDGRRTYFKANPESPLYGDLRGLMQKTAGIVPTLTEALNAFGNRIDMALVYGSVARGEERAQSDVDVLIVGTIKQIDLVPVLRRLEDRFRRQVNVTLFAPRDFDRKVASGDHFINSVLKSKTILLKGPNDLEATA